MKFGVDLTAEVFTARYWRRQPLLIRGGAAEVLPVRLRADEFELLSAQIEIEHPDDVTRDGSDVTFVQRIDRASPALSAAAGAVASVLFCPSVWIDGVLARNGRSIGCHYDHSDNFVVQQEGVKIWRLHDPSVIPRNELRRRMRNEVGVGAMYMPDDYEEFILQAGDFLYIPLFWIHHGISSGPSLSLSVVCNPDPSDPKLNDLLGSGWRYQKFEAARPRSSEPPVIDEDRIQAFFASQPIPPDPASLVLPSGRNGPHAGLMRALARPYLRRLLMALVRTFAVQLDATTVEHLRCALRLVQALDDDALERLVVRPELTSWTFRAGEALRYQYAPRIEQIVRHLGPFLLPALLEASIDFEGDRLLVPESENAAIDLLPLRCRIRLKHWPTGPVWATIAGDTLLLDTGVRRVEVPIATLLESNSPAKAAAGTWVEPIASTDRGELALLIRHNWFEEFLPRGRNLRVSPLHLDLVPAERALFATCVNEGLDLIHEHWFEAWEELDAAVSVVMPLRSDGLRPHNESIPAFRGLIRTSARPSYLAAQSLIHETGHNKLNSILDLHGILEDDTAVHRSPFVGEDRPMIAIIHGIFAFMVDAHVSVRVAAHVDDIDGMPIDPYVEQLSANLEEALEIVKRHARLTEAGTRLYAGLVNAFDAINGPMPKGAHNDVSGSVGIASTKHRRRRTVSLGR